MKQIALTKFREHFILLAMRMSVLSAFVCVILSNVYATVEAQIVNLKEKNISYRSIFKEINKQTGYSYFWSTDEINPDSRINVTVENKSLKEALNIILGEKDINFDIKDKVIIVQGRIKEKSIFSLQKSNSLTEISTNAIQEYVKGIVTDDLGQPLIGATLTVKGKNTSVKTNQVGSFSIKAEIGDVITVSYMGFVSQSITVLNNNALTIKLKEVVNDLDDVVVVGYAKQKKSQVTGSVAQVGAEVFEGRPITQAAQGLQGKIPNLNISYSDGVPDRGASFNIRGTNSINGGSPLVLIDNAPGDINLINPEDIESVSVLKDAASASIYGGRAAFGVILITTKSGKKGSAKVRFSTNLGTMSPTRLPETINTLDALVIQNEAYKGYNGTYLASYNKLIDYIKQRQADPTLPEMFAQSDGSWLSAANNDWYDMFYNKNQFFNKNYLSISGGNDKTKYYISGGYLNQEGTFKVATDILKRYSTELKLDHQLTDWLNVSNNISYMQSDYNSPNRFSNSESTTVYRYLSLMGNPYASVYTPNGNLTYEGSFVFGGLLNGSFNNTTTRQIKDLFALRTNFLNNKLHINGEYSLVYSPSNNYILNKKSTYESALNVMTTSASTDYYRVSNSNEYTHTFNLFGDYEHSFNDHTVKLLAGFNQELNAYKSFYARRNGNTSESLASLNLTNSDVYYMGDSAYEVALRGGFGRINYDYQNKYMFELNGRYDGTSRFPKKDRFGFFPSGSVGWMVSREKFMQNVSKKWLSDLKLRASYGELGNQALSSAYPYITNLTITQGSNIINGVAQKQASSPAIVSNSLTWERVQTTNLGFDLSSLNNRLTLGFDYYTRNTLDMLTKGRTLPEVLGATEPKENAADLQTKGFELSVEWKDRFQVKSKPLTYTFNVVWSDNISKITKYDNPSRLLSDYYVGEVIGEVWGYGTVGFFKTDNEWETKADQSRVSTIEYSVSGHPLAGDIRFYDANKDGVIDPGDNTVDNPGDRFIIGNTSPRYNFGVNFNANWNGFGLNIFVQGVGKRDFWPGIESGVFWGSYNRYNQPIYSHIANNYWTEENTEAYFPRLRAYNALTNTRSLGQVQTRYLQDASYARLKDVTLSYNLGLKKISSKFNNSSVRIFFSGYNLIEWTNLSKAFDPEGLNADAGGASSVGAGFTYPVTRTYTFGLDFNF